MRDLNDYFYFVQVVDFGGFSSAARAIGVQKSLLSRRIALLETRLHTRLLQRSSRHFSVTETGRRFYGHCKAMLAEAELAEQSIAQLQAEPCGIIRMSCPVALLNFQFGAILARFIMRYPLVRLQLESTNRRVDILQDGLDLAVRVRFPPIEASDLVMRVLDTSTQCLVAAPELLTAGVRSPADLTAFSSMDFHTSPAEQSWILEDGHGQTATVYHEPRLVTDDMAVLREAALSGIGVVQLPTIMVWKDVQAGRLVQVLPQWTPRAGIVHAVFPSRKGLMPGVRALLDFMAEECTQQRQMATSTFLAQNV
ncbi:LysR substrate-binding domain-containing protein [Acetobacter sp. LMG 32666]|uniref:LysR substrate-binding domain-containing protein n=1 Tax=Acetobacter sp. LMG 32666 TaxID=2959295 RepID=UPI0030C8BFCE